MIILALDPSSSCVGWGLLRCDEDYRGTELVNYGKYSPSSKLQPAGRITAIQEWLSHFFEKTNITQSVQEKASLPYNGKTINRQNFNVYVKAEGQVYQGCKAVLGRESCFGVYPQTWLKSNKKHITMKNCNWTYGTNFEEKDHDISDAIMIGTWFIDRMRVNPIPCYEDCTF